jgi:hypothetical protein
VEAGDRGKEQICSAFQSQFHELYLFEPGKLGTAAGRGGELHAILRTDYCRLPGTPIGHTLGAETSPTATVNGTRAVAVVCDSDPFQVPIPNFQYRYPDEIPEIDQEAVEAIRAEANRKIASEFAGSYEELVQARYAWVVEVAAGAALIFGRLAAREHWGANRRRDVLRHFAIQAAYAGHLTYLVARRFFESIEWKELDSLLFPSLTLDGGDGQVSDQEETRHEEATVVSADPLPTAQQSQAETSGREEGDRWMAADDSTALGSITVDAFEDDSGRPLGDNPFPPGHAAHEAFEGLLGGQ